MAELLSQVERPDESPTTTVRPSARERPPGPDSGAGDGPVVTSTQSPLHAPRLTLPGLALVIAVGIGVIAVAVLAGWGLGVPGLTAWLPGLVQTKVNAAVCLLALAIALALVASNNRKGNPFASALAVLVVVIALATLIEHVAGVDLGIDQIIVKDQASAASPHPGRFAIQTAFGFLAAALAILSMGRSVRGVHPTELFATVCALIGGISLLGYLYGAQPLLSLGSANQVSLPASFAMALLPIGLIAADPEHALSRQMTDAGPAGQVMRRIIPAAFVIVPVGAWLRLMGQRAGLYDESVGLSILVTLEALLLVAVGAWTTTSVRRLVLERRQAEIDLVRLGSAVSTPLIETAPIGLAVLDRDLRYLYANPALASIDGLDALAHLGQRVDRVSPQLGLETAAMLEGVLSSGRGIRDIEVSGYSSAGEQPETWLLSAEPLHDDTREAVGLALSIVEISERKRREEALAALSELQNQAQVISESIPFGFWTADLGGRMRYLSQSFLTLIGRTEEEAQGLGWAEALAPETAEATMRDWQIAVAAGRPWSFEFTVHGTDGRSHTILSRGFPIFDGDGQFTSWAGMNLDITDRKEAEAFREAFAGILSHELRTPITSINAASTLLRRDGLDDQQRAELLDDIGQESERLARLVEDLVVLAKVERGTIQIRTEPVLLHHVLRKVCAKEQARSPNRRIEFSSAGRLPVARAEPAFVEQIVRNLIGNAVKYGPSDGQIDVIADTLDGHPRVRVLDRGPGIDPSESERLFDLFYRSERTAGVAGSGIGLFLAHRLIESMDGTIWARPRDDGPGAEFGFTLQPIDEDS
jgi:PAS domain S-box-containing protein